MQNNWICRA